MSKGQNLGLAFLASAVMTAPAYGQERVLCTRDFNTGAVICPEQQQRVYAPTGPAQQPPVVVAEPQHPNPVSTFFVGLAAGVVGAAIASHGHHHGGGPVYVGGPRYVAPADRPYYDNRAVTVDPHGYMYRNPSYGCYRTDRGSVRCP